MIRFKVNEVNDILSCPMNKGLVMDSNVDRLELYNLADSMNIVLSISSYIVDARYITVIPQNPHDSSMVDVARQIVTLAASSPNHSASVHYQPDNILSFRSTIYKEVKNTGIRCGVKINVTDELVSLNLNKDNFSIVKIVSRLMENISDGGVKIPLSIARNKAALVTAIHQEAMRRHIKISTRTIGDNVVVSLNYNYHDRVSNSALRERIRMLSWDVPTPLTTPDKSALLSTLAAQNPLQCFTVKAGVITKRPFIIKKHQGNTVLRVFGQIVYTGDDHDKMNEILKQYGKTVEDAL